MKSILTSIVLLIILISCGQEPTKESTKTIQKNLGETTKESTEPAQKNFNKEDVAKYTISSIMNQPPEIINVKKDGDIYLVSYTRKDDGQKFNYKIKIDGDKVIWGNIDGRWRDTEQDEIITYSENGGKLKIVQTFDDGSTIDNEFDRNN